MGLVIVFLFKCLRLFSHKGHSEYVFSANLIADVDEGGKLTPKLHNRSCTELKFVSVSDTRVVVCQREVSVSPIFICYLIFRCPFGIPFCMFATFGIVNKLLLITKDKSCALLVSLAPSTVSSIIITSSKNYFDNDFQYLLLPFSF